MSSTVSFSIGNELNPDYIVRLIYVSNLLNSRMGRLRGWYREKGLGREQPIKGIKVDKRDLTKDIDQKTLSGIFKRIIDAGKAKSLNVTLAEKRLTIEFAS
ncbi:MAG: hypothetical protein K1060chlam2_01175 [Chlamydiae bacterium]|nr:hypothetical protein [Chlamydiota bacterium]